MHKTFLVVCKGNEIREFFFSKEKDARDFMGKLPEGVALEFSRVICII